MNKKDIIVVSGLPRSGTSLMMQILHSMGIDIFTDNIRLPDESNPKGYFEHELVKTIEKDNSWVKEVKGKAIKIVSPLLIYLPLNYVYRIIFMNRNLNEIMRSQEKMMSFNNMDITKIEPEILEQIFVNDLNQAWIWIKEKSHSKFLEISYSELFENSKSEIEKVRDFLNINTGLETIIKVIDKNLYRTKIT